jgi:hypothetical protein
MWNLSTIFANFWFRGRKWVVTISLFSSVKSGRRFPRCALIGLDRRSEIAVPKYVSFTHKNLLFSPLLHQSGVTTRTSKTTTCSKFLAFHPEELVERRKRESKSFSLTTTANTALVVNTNAVHQRPITNQPLLLHPAFRRSHPLFLLIRLRMTVSLGPWLLAVCRPLALQPALRYLPLTTPLRTNHRQLCQLPPSPIHVHPVPLAPLQRPLSIHQLPQPQVLNLLLTNRPKASLPPFQAGQYLNTSKRP